MATEPSPDQHNNTGEETMARKSAFKVVVGSCVAGAFIVAPGMAGATKSYQGSDWSQDFNHHHQMQTCDQEADGKDVHSDAKLGSGLQVGRASRDTDGSGGSCGTSGYFSSAVVQHRTCEEIDFWPDKCGNWVGTGA